MKTYTVFFMRGGYVCIFISGISVSLGTANSIADNLFDEFGVTAWAEED